MKILAKDLTDEQQKEFTDEFYWYPINELEDYLESPCPWGCPWLWSHEKVLEGETIQEMAHNFYLENEKEILRLIKEDRENKNEKNN